MALSRRSFLATGAAAALARPFRIRPPQNPQVVPTDRFDPWIEIDRAALRHNVGVLARLAGGRPILAVLKNNAYGLGLTTVAPLLEPLPEIAGFAVVKTEEALALVDAGVRKPVLLMGLFADRDGAELVRRGVQLSLCTPDAAERVTRAVRAAGRPAQVHIDIDTGMNRVGIPYHQALPLVREFARLEGVVIEGLFMTFTEDAEFDREQLRRFLELAGQARAAGVRLGRLHAASSHAVFNFKESHLDMVRPGISIYGAYPTDEGTERSIAELKPAFRLRARVVRVAQLRAGDSVSYGRNYVATKATWIATLPVGHADGYPRGAVKGARLLIGDALYPVIGAVSASHTIVELGERPAAAVGDVATLAGADQPGIQPNALATAAGGSVYDVLMHLNPDLPKVVM
jgi:alanine racemase